MWVFSLSFKRKGSHVAKTLMWQQIYSAHANINTCGMLTQLSFLTSLVARLKSSPDEVLASMRGVRGALTGAGNLRVYVAGDLTTLPPNSLQLWQTFPSQPG